MKKIFLLAIVFGALYLFPVSVSACEVIEVESDTVVNKETVKKRYLETFKGAIFAGKVVSIQDATVNWFGNPSPMNEVTIEVEKHWFGVKERQTKVYTGYGGGDCSLKFEVGKRYFLEIYEVSGFLWATFDNSKKIDSEESLAERGKFFDEIYGAGKSFPKTAK